MSAIAIVLPFLWATQQQELPAPRFVAPEPIQPELAFYRKYTEGMLRRYLRLSMEKGKVSSLLGHEMFRAKVTNYRVQSFDDVVIFVHDVEKCLARLAPAQQVLLDRVVLQEYTFLEIAESRRIKLWSVVRRYHMAVDSLTAIFLEVNLIQPLKSCQVPYPVDNHLLHSY